MRKIAWLAMALLFLPGIFPGVASAQEGWSAGIGADMTSISAAPDGSRIAVGSRDAKALVYEADGSLAFEAPAGNVVNAVELLEDGSLLLASDDRRLHAYDRDGTQL